MKRSFTTLLFIATLFLSLRLFPSCVEEPTVATAGQRVNEIVISLNWEDTKAVANDSDPDNSISGVDVYEYNSSGTLLEHFTLGSDELAYHEFSRRADPGTVRYYYVVANIDSESAAWLEQFGLRELGTEEALIPASAHNYSTHHPLMAGTVRCDFSSSGLVPLDLYRYMFKVNIGRIKVDFEDASLMGKDVYIKSVSLTNTSALYRLLGEDNSPLSRVGSPAFLFGPLSSPAYGDAFFGGLTSGYKSGPQSYESDAVISYTGQTGKLSGSFPVYLNLNYRKAPGVLYIDAAGDLFEATYHGYDTTSGQGQVCSSTDPSISHELTVDRSFYGIPQTPYYPERYLISSEYDTQGYYPRLVIETVIDGNTVYYPICLYGAQPNTVYDISDITLSGRGSRYSNFIERTYRMEVTMSVRPWTVATLSNMDMGYTSPNKYTIY